MLDIPQVVQGYKPRPLEGVWATPPFLHNGSIPNLYELLSPAYERSRSFFVGRREFDPVKVGYVDRSRLSKQGFLVRHAAAREREHRPRVPRRLRAVRRAAPERTQFGVIGPELTPDERWEIIEYLKIHSDEPTGRPAADGRPSPTAPPRLARLQTPRSRRRNGATP